MTRTRRLLGVLVMLGAWPATVARAHPIHTTYGDVRIARGTATLWVRAFADDFAAAVARHHGHAAPADSSAAPSEVARYLGATVTVVDARGRPVAVTGCGVRRAGAVTWTCVSWAAAPGQRLVNRLLADLHPDQVNVVQVQGGPTLLFSGRDPRARTLD